MTQMLNIIEDLLAYRGIQLCRLDGDCSAELRQREIDKFMADVG